MLLVDDQAHSRASQLRAHLRAAIVSGDLPPGTNLRCHLVTLPESLKA